jgi:hypothetical protein
MLKYWILVVEEVVMTSGCETEVYAKTLSHVCQLLGDVGISNKMTTIFLGL